MDMAGTANLGYISGASSGEVTSSTGTNATIPGFTSTNAGLAGASGGGTTNFLRADGTWTNPPGTTDLTYTTAATTGTINSSTGTDATIPKFTSTDAGLVHGSGGGTANFLRADGTWDAPSTNLGYTPAASQGTVTSSNGTSAILPEFTSTEAGLVSGSGGGSTNFLRADGTWHAPPGVMAGADTQVQFNDNGGAGGDTGLTFNKTTNELTVGVSNADPGTATVKGDLNLDSGGNFATTIQSVTPTANRTISFPDATGTVALVSGANGTIQYNDAGTLKGNSDFTVDPDWNDAATVFTGLKLNVTDGAGGSPVGNSDSKLLDLQSGGTSKFYVKASGTQLIGGCTLNVAEFSNQSGVPTVFSPLVNRHFFSWSNFNRIQLGADVKLNWSNVDGNANAATDVGLVRSTAGVIRVTNSSTGTGYIKQDPVAISALPDPTNATGVGAGTRGFVNDASSTTFAAVVAVGTNDGGSTVVPVYSDGTSWRIG